MKAPHGPFRLFALKLAGAGTCAICRTRPVVTINPRGWNKGCRYTCRRPACIKGWARLAQRDWHYAQRRQVSKPKPASPLASNNDMTGGES